MYHILQLIQQAANGIWHFIAFFWSSAGAWLEDTLILVAQDLLQAFFAFLSALSLPADLGSLHLTGAPAVMWDVISDLGLPASFGILLTAYGTRWILRVCTLFLY